MKKSKKLILLLVTMIVIFVVFHNLYTGPDSTSKALKKELIPLKTVQASSGFEDLEPLNEMFWVLRWLF